MATFSLCPAPRRSLRGTEPAGMGGEGVRVGAALSVSDPEVGRLRFRVPAPVSGCVFPWKPR